MMENLLAISLSKRATQAEESEAEVATTSRYAESLSSRMLDRLIGKPPFSNWFDAILVEVRDRRRADEL
jgi:hypothetical protein